MKMHVPILSTVEKAAQVALRDVGRAVLNKARELSPTLTGESDSSGFVAVDDLTVQVGFQSFVSLRQHEVMDYQHANGDQPKFLETAVDLATPNIETIMAARMRAALGG